RGPGAGGRMIPSTTPRPRKTAQEAMHAMSRPVRKKMFVHFVQLYCSSGDRIPRPSVNERP
ncbi:MAG TPA: hypothetical protein VJM57_05980, partial [Thermodesulfobacteriota bacterium]|nr:hypothetical protein [Thermodesulfobacteriota bacterium]